MFTGITEDLNFIGALSDRPGEDGLDASEIKTQFDKAANILKDYINSQIISKLNTDGSSHIKSPLIEGLAGGTVYNQLVSIGERLTVSGTVFLYAGVELPQNVLLCDGSAVGRTAYSGLFDKIGTFFGQGDGYSTFNLPNLTSNNPSSLIRYVIYI